MDQEEINAQQRVTLTEVVRDMPQITSANTTNNWTAVTNSITSSKEYGHMVISPSNSSFRDVGSVSAYRR